MKWFKHITKSKYDTKLMRIIRKHGLRGYGLYFAVLEGIAFQLEPEKPIPELEEDASDIAAFFGEDTLKIEEIIKDCIDEKLFEINSETKRIICSKLLAYLDNTMAQNPQIRSILSNFNLLKGPAIPLKQIRVDVDESRSDEIRQDEKREEEQQQAAAADTPPPVKKNITPEKPDTRTLQPFERLAKAYEKRWAKFPPTRDRDSAIRILERVQPTDAEIAEIVDGTNNFSYVLDRLNYLEKKKRPHQQQAERIRLEKRRDELQAIANTGTAPDQVLADLTLIKSKLRRVHGVNS